MEKVKRSLFAKGLREGGMMRQWNYYYGSEIILYETVGMDYIIAYLSRLRIYNTMSKP